MGAALRTALMTHFDNARPRAMPNTIGLILYESETSEIIRRFLAQKLTFAECISSLDAALAGMIPRLTGEQIKRLRIVMLANNEIVMKELERRGQPEVHQ